MKILDFRLQTLLFRLKTSDFRLQTSGWSLKTTDFGLETSYWRLNTGDLILETSDWDIIPRTSDLRPLRLETISDAVRVSIQSGYSKTSLLSGVRESEQSYVSHQSGVLCLVLERMHYEVSATSLLSDVWCQRVWYKQWKVRSGCLEKFALGNSHQNSGKP